METIIEYCQELIGMLHENDIESWVGECTYAEIINKITDIEDVAKKIGGKKRYGTK